MAIFHFHAQVIGRSAGRSCVAAAAYRSGQRIRCERQGLTFDFRRKREVVYRAIMAPQPAPAWAINRSLLWNEVERCEKRHDAQVAREIDVALPLELSDQQHQRLLKEFVAEHLVARGMVVDIAIHANHGNPHAHLMLTTRRIDASGFGAKAREWNDKALLESWRTSWADKVNSKLRLYGHAARIDHRTLEAQGIDREPTTHLGSTRHALRMKEQQRSSTATHSITTSKKENPMSEENQSSTVAAPAIPGLQSKIASNRPSPASMSHIHADRQHGRAKKKSPPMKRVSEFILAPFQPNSMTAYKSTWRVGTKEIENMLRQTFPNAEVSWKFDKGAYYHEVKLGQTRIRDYGSSIRCEANDAVAVQATITLAKAKGWPGILLKGSIDFRRAAWKEAVAQGYAPETLSGYEPSPNEVKEALAQKALATIQVAQLAPPPPKIAEADGSKDGEAAHDSSPNGEPRPAGNGKGGLKI